MTQTSYSRTASFRAAALGALGALALLTACEARMPTSAEIDDMDVASAEARTQELGWVDPGLETATYYLDGVEVTPEQARAQKAEGLARVEIVRGATAGPEIRLTSREASDARADGTSATGAPAQGAPAEPAASAAPAGRVSAVPAAGFDGLVFIDGEEATAEELRELAPSEIARVEVIKGAAAAGVSDDPRAAKGIIRLTTKAASPQG